MKYEELDKSFRDAFFFGFAISREGFNADVPDGPDIPRWIDDDRCGGRMDLNDLREYLEDTKEYKQLCLEAYDKILCLDAEKSGNCCNAVG